MNRCFTTLGAAALAATTATIGCQRTQDSGATRSSVDAVERGHYLVTIMVCEDCHTPHRLGADGLQPEPTRALSGHPNDFDMGEAPALASGGWLWVGASSNTAFAGPWGMTYATNLTPDEETGIGFWTEEMFISALRNGKKYGSGRPLQPPMPWRGYAQATDDDLRAMFAYLKSVRPITNHVPEWQPPPVE
jgi:hypothetical protein